LSEDSSDSLPDPFVETESRNIAQLLSEDRQRNTNNNEEHEMQQDNYTSCPSPSPGPSGQMRIDLTNDDTLPLEMTIRFTVNGTSVLTGDFDHNLKVEVCTY